MVEGIVELPTNDEVVPFLQLDRFLRGEIPELETRRSEGVAADISVLPEDDHILEIVPGSSEVPCCWIKAERRIEVHKGGSIKAKTHAGIASSSRVKTCLAVVDGNRRIPQRRPIVIEGIAVGIESINKGLRRTG